MICTFSLGPKEIYAIPATELVELIAKPSEISELGIMAIRDEFITLLDPMEYFGFNTPNEHDDVVLICTVDGSKIGMLVHSVYDVFDILDEDVMEDPIDSDVVAGVITNNDQLVVLLNLSQLSNNIVDLK